MRWTSGRCVNQLILNVWRCKQAFDAPVLFHGPGGLLLYANLGAGTWVRCGTHPLDTQRPRYACVGRVGKLGS